MEGVGADGDKRACGRVALPVVLAGTAPAVNGPLEVDAARLPRAGRHRRECAARRIELSLVAEAPAVDEPTRQNRARVPRSGGHAVVGAFRYRALTRVGSLAPHASERARLVEHTRVVR